MSRVTIFENNKKDIFNVLVLKDTKFKNIKRGRVITVQKSKTVESGEVVYFRKDGDGGFDKFDNLDEGFEVFGIVKSNESH